MFIQDFKHSAHWKNRTNGLHCKHRWTFHWLDLDEPSVLITCWFLGKNNVVKIYCFDWLQNMIKFLSLDWSSQWSPKYGWREFRWKRIFEAWGWTVRPLVFFELYLCIQLNILLVLIFFPICRTGEVGFFEDHIYQTVLGWLGYATVLLSVPPIS